MATYALGDIQGCHAPLQRLLDTLQFDPAQDRLWFAGDLVSRGQHSLETLRHVRDLSAAGVALSVLGNHDISLLAAAYGLIEPHKSLKALLDAADKADLLNWLQQQPLLHRDDNLQSVLVHAGIAPHWTLEEAEQQARAAEAALRQPNPTDWLQHIYGNEPARWADCTSDNDRQRYTINIFTRMRYLYADGSLEFKQKLNPIDVQKSHPKLIPWFIYPKRKEISHTIYFGHWSTLGYHQKNNVTALDTGCVWGGRLTAVRIDSDNKTKYQVTCQDYERREKG